jgi:hypothetical protein
MVGNVLLTSFFKEVKKAKTLTSLVKTCLDREWIGSTSLKEVGKRLSAAYDESSQSDNSSKGNKGSKPSKKSRKISSSAANEDGDNGDRTMYMSKFRRKLIIPTGLSFERVVDCGVPTYELCKTSFMRYYNKDFEQFINQTAAYVTYIRSLLTVFKNNEVNYHEQGQFQPLMKLLLQHLCSGIAQLMKKLRNTVDTYHVLDANNCTLTATLPSVHTNPQVKQSEVVTKFVGNTDLVVSSSEWIQWEKVNAIFELKRPLDTLNINNCADKERDQLLIELEAMSVALERKRQKMICG